MQKCCVGYKFSDRICVLEIMRALFVLLIAFVCLFIVVYSKLFIGGLSGKTTAGLCCACSLAFHGQIYYVGFFCISFVCEM